MGDSEEHKKQRKLDDLAGNASRSKARSPRSWENENGQFLEFTETGQHENNRGKVQTFLPLLR
ncbi:hypothetical protein AYI68_g2545, partial [Smittium mucronatum]